MKINAITTNQNFCAKISRTGVMPDENRKATRHEVFEGYDNALNAIANQKKLALEVRKLFKTDGEIKEIMAELPCLSSLYDGTGIHVVVDKKTNAKNPVNFEKPFLAYFDSKSDGNIMLELDNDEKDLKSKVLDWLEQLPVAKCTVGSGASIVFPQTSAYIKKQCETASEKIEHDKQIAQKLDDFMFANKTVRTIAKKLPEEAIIYVMDDCRVDEDREEREIYTLSPAILYYNQNTMACDRFSDIENPDGTLKEKEIINWLKNVEKN